MKATLAAGEYVISRTTLAQFGSPEQYRALLDRINHPEEDTDG